MEDFSGMTTREEILKYGIRFFETVFKENEDCWYVLNIDKKQLAEDYLETVRF